MPRDRVSQQTPDYARRTGDIGEEALNQLTVIDEYTRHKYMELAIVAIVNWLK